MRTVALLLLLLTLPRPALAAVPTGSSWSVVEAPSVRVHHQEEHRPLAVHLAAVAAEEGLRLEQWLGQRGPATVDVILAPDSETFQDLQPGQAPHWAAGTAWPEHGEIWLRADLRNDGPQRIEHVLAHELAHTYLGAVLPQRAPRWFDEGFARAFAFEWTVEEQVVLLQAALWGDLGPISTLNARWPSEAGPARVAYAQSADFVRWIQGQDDGAMPRLVRLLARGQSMDLALRGSIGIDLATAEARWRERLGFWRIVLPAVVTEPLIWSLAAALFIIGGVRRIRRKHRQIAAMPTPGEGPTEGDASEMPRVLPAPWTAKPRAIGVQAGAPW